MQSVPITAKFVSSSPVRVEVYPIQQYVIKFVSDLLQVGGFSPGTLVSTINKTDRHDIAELLLKVALNLKPTITSNVGRVNAYLIWIVSMEVLFHQPHLDSSDLWYQCCRNTVLPCRVLQLLG